MIITVCEPPTLEGGLAASASDLLGALAELRDELLHPCAALLERVGPVGLRREDCHDLSLQRASFVTVCDTGSRAHRTPDSASSCSRCRLRNLGTRLSACPEPSRSTAGSLARRT